MEMRVIAVVLMLLAVAGTSRADDANTELSRELAELNELILKDPQNIELNLRYARLAEQQGDLRKALSAYERVTVNNPSNQEGQQGYRRVSRKLQPATTNVTVEVGGGWESNPTRDAVVHKPDWLALARVEIKDERSFGDVHWRTLGTGLGEFYKLQGGDLNYTYAGGLTGPMADLTSQAALHTALGGGAASFAQRLLYHEGLLGFTLETALWGGSQNTKLRVGYRRYADFYGGSEGFYADLSARLGFTDVFQKKDLIVVTPSSRWSGISGIALNIPMEETQPGHYWEWGLRAEYFLPLVDWLTLGTSMSVSHRRYIDVTFLDTGEPILRRDWLFIPGASLIFPKVFGKDLDLRLDYKYEENRSNVDFDRYIDHQITTSAVFRF